jgi:hypothetical protein
MGSIYRRTFTHCRTCRKRIRGTAAIARCELAGHTLSERESPIWYIAYETPTGWRNESSRSEHKVDAQRLLRDREGAMDRGQGVARGFTFDDAAEAALAEYKMHKRRSLDVFERRITKHLTPVFSGRELSEITTPTIRDFITARQQTGASNGDQPRAGLPLEDVQAGDSRRQAVCPPAHSQAERVGTAEGLRDTRGIYRHR